MHACLEIYISKHIYRATFLKIQSSSDEAFISCKGDFILLLLQKHEYICIYPTPPHKQGATQGQFLNRV